MGFNLTIADKIKQIRLAQGLKITPLAELARIGPKRISAAENGKGEYTKKQFHALQVALDILGLPLMDSERPAWEERFYAVRDYARDGTPESLTKAKALHKNMAKIVNLEPCDFNLVALYRAMDVYISLAAGDIKAVEAKLDFFQSNFDKMDNANRYHYYGTSGSLAVMQNRHEDALKLYLKALKLTENHDNILPEEDERLYHNIAMCYSYLEFPHRAISFALKAKDIYPKIRTSTFCFHIDIILGLNRSKTGEVEEAIKISEKCLVNAKARNDNLSVGLALYNLGYAYKKAEDWKTAIEHFDQALKYFEKDSGHFKSSLNQKSLCVVETRQFSIAEHMINHARTANRANKLWAVYFEGLWHYLIVSRRISISNEESSKYIEEVAIPYFFRNHDYFGALDYCKLLFRHYEKILNKSKASAMKCLMYDICDRCIMNGNSWRWPD